jgi:transposase-like protein
MNASSQFCPHEACSARGRTGEGNIRIYSYNPQRYRCTTCKKTFSIRRGTVMEGLRTDEEKVITVVTLLSYGCPIQAIVHAFGLDERTVSDWQEIERLNGTFRERLASKSVKMPPCSGTCGNTGNQTVLFSPLPPTCILSTTSADFMSERLVQLANHLSFSSALVHPGPVIQLGRRSGACTS